MRKKINLKKQRVLALVLSLWIVSINVGSGGCFMTPLNIRVALIVVDLFRWMGNSFLFAKMNFDSPIPFREPAALHFFSSLLRFFCSAASFFVRCKVFVWQDVFLFRATNTFIGILEHIISVLAKDHRLSLGNCDVRILPFLFHFWSQILLKNN